MKTTNLSDIKAQNIQVAKINSYHAFNEDKVGWLKGCIERQLKQNPDLFQTYADTQGHWNI